MYNSNLFLCGLTLTFDLSIFLDPSTLESISLIEIYPDANDTKYVTQILRDIGLPIVGDAQKDLMEIQANPLRRVALHCSEVKLNHTTTRELLVLQAPLPPSFESLMSAPQSSHRTEPEENIVSNNPPSLSVVKVISVSDFLGTNKPMSKSSRVVHKEDEETTRRGDNSNINRRRNRH